MVLKVMRTDGNDVDDHDIDNDDDNGDVEEHPSLS